MRTRAETAVGPPPSLTIAELRALGIIGEQAQMETGTDAAVLAHASAARTGPQPSGAARAEPVAPPLPA